MKEHCTGVGSLANLNGRCVRLSVPVIVASLHHHSNHSKLA